MKRISIQRGICYSVGFVFIISGIAKLVMSDFRIIFHNLALPYSNTSLFLVAITEMICGTLVISNLYLRQAVIPLLSIMVGAIFLTKIPLLSEDDGLISFLFEARLDLVMLFLLLVLWHHSPQKG